MSLARILRNDEALWSLLALPGILFYGMIFASYSMTDLDFWKSILSYSGYTALAFFVLILALNPLVYLAPGIQWIKSLNTHRRAIGVASFLYICPHLLAFITLKIMKTGSFPLSSFLYPFILPAFLAFCILLLLTATSNNYSVQKLRYDRWKLIHRSVYVAEFLIFIHLLLQGDLQITVACLVFIPLIILQWFARKSVRVKHEAHY